MKDLIEALRCVGFMIAGVAFFLVLRGEAHTVAGGLALAGTLGWFLLCEVLWKMYVWRGPDDDDTPLTG